MGKKAKEYKSGDFIFAKVKGYPAWPARVQRLNGKKYFVYFYGTGETANLPANMIFDYSENKDKFLGKAVKRRDFNEGVRQIEHDFTNNVPLEEVVGAGAPEAPAEANDSANDTMEDSAMDTTAADDTVADTTAGNATQNDVTVEDSDDAGALVIDEGKQQAKGRKSKAPEPVKTPKTPKTPRGKGKPGPAKDGPKEGGKEGDEEELVSRSGRKIRPKRYLDEQTKENATLPSPAPKRRRGASPPPPPEEGGAGGAGDTKGDKPVPGDKQVKQFNNVSRSELDELKEPFKPDAEKENILIAYLPNGQYVGIKVFGNRPANCKDAAARLQWDKRSARNALQLATDLERGHITPQSVLAQLVMDLHLTDEEKATLDKERETEEKRSRVQFLKTEMKLIELDAKIKTCLCLERADTAHCLQLLDQLLELDVKPLMLLKHPTCLETVKRMRAYVGNTPSWDLTEQEALTFAKQAHRIRKQADTLYRNMKELFTPPPSLSFWEHFSERVLHFKRCTAALPADRLLEMHREPPEMSEPSVHTMSAAVEAAAAPATAAAPAADTDSKTTGGDTPVKKSNAKTKKAANSTPAKQTPRRQNSRKQLDKEKEVDTAAAQPDHTDKPAGDDENTTGHGDATQPENNTEKQNAGDTQATNESTPMEGTETEGTESTEAKENTELTDTSDKQSEKVVEKTKKDTKREEKAKEASEKQEASEKPKRSSRSKKTSEQDEDTGEKQKESSEKGKDSERAKDGAERSKEKDKAKESGDKTKDKSEKVKENSEKTKESSEKVKQSDKEKESSDTGAGAGEEGAGERGREEEPRAKRSRGESKKTDPPPRSPGRNPPRKSKA